MSSTFKETFTVKGEQLLKKIKELIEEGYYFFCLLQQC